MNLGWESLLKLQVLATSADSKINFWDRVRLERQTNAAFDKSFCGQTENAAVKWLSKSEIRRENN